MLEVQNRDANTLTMLILKHVRRGSTIYTDGWGGYKHLRFFGYVHQKVLHNKNFVCPVTGTHTNTIEGTWSALKADIPKRHRMPEWIGFYLRIFRYNRNVGSDLFMLLLNNLLH